MHSELPSLFRIRVEEIIRREMQPVEAALMANLDFVGLIHECQDQLSRAYRSSDGREERLEVAQPGNEGTALASQGEAERSRTVEFEQPRQSSPHFFKPVSDAPPAQDQDNFGLDFSILGKKIPDLQTRKETSDTTSGSHSGYASGRLCDCIGSCSCSGWSMVSRAEGVDHSDSLVAGLAPSQPDDLQEQSVQWQSWMENQDWVF
jgi:hypothetical protein